MNRKTTLTLAALATAALLAGCASGIKLQDLSLIHISEPTRPY